MTKIRKICSVCGSAGISVDTSAQWDEERQLYVSEDRPTWDVYCNDCDACVGLIDISVYNDLARCQNCDWKGDTGYLKDIKDLHERVAPGEPCPVGECPHCGALCHLHKTAPEPNMEADDRLARITTIPIHITMDGGLIQSVEFPPGYVGPYVEVWDYDTEGGDEDRMETGPHGETYYRDVWEPDNKGTPGLPEEGLDAGIPVE